METTPIDVAAYEELTATVGPEFVIELVDAFLHEGPTMLAELRRASADGDADAYRRAAHSLKSNAATFGATELAQLARAAELNGYRAGDLDRIDQVYEITVAHLEGLVRG